jgi:rubrerythrin
MNIFEFAKEKEKFSEHYYHELAEKTTHKGLKHICSMLAEEEAKHLKIVQEMQNKNAEIPAESHVLKNAKKVFESMRQSAEKFDFKITELEMFQKARDIEQESKEFYLEKAEEVEDERQKEIFYKLAGEEEKHYFVIDNICEFLDRPNWFLENAEMYRFDDYDGGTL